MIDDAAANMCPPFVYATYQHEGSRHRLLRHTHVIDRDANTHRFALGHSLFSEEFELTVQHIEQSQSGLERTH